MVNEQEINFYGKNGIAASPPVIKVTQLNF